MNKVLFVARVTLREALQQELAVNLLVFALLLVAVFLGAGLVAGDVRRRTLNPVVAKPVGCRPDLLHPACSVACVLAFASASFARCDFR